MSINKIQYNIMKTLRFWNFVSDHMAELSLILIVVFTMFSFGFSFLKVRPEQKLKTEVTIDSTQVINVKLINDTTNVY